MGERIVHVPVQGAWSRHVRAGEGGLETGRGGRGGRFHRPGQLAVYLADSDATAWAEWYRWLAEQAYPPDQGLPRDLHRIAVDLDTVIDLKRSASRSYCPMANGSTRRACTAAPVDEIAISLLDMDDPAQSCFVRLTGPPGSGKSQVARAIAYRLWASRGRTVGERHGVPFYGFVELQPGPSSDEFFFRYDYVPVAGNGGQVQLVDSAFVAAMRTATRGR
ncbi:MAG: RES domain-containing protein [Solirubrobacteraceae bacterium]